MKNTIYFERISLNKMNHFKRTELKMAIAMTTQMIIKIVIRPFLLR